MGSPFFGFQYQQKPEVSFLSPDYGAIQAGFKSAADQEANRMMRNQLEMKAAQAGVSNEEAYKLVEGPLTSTSALQEAWNKLQAPAPATTTTPAATTPAKSAPTTPYSDQVAQAEADLSKKTEPAAPSLDEILGKATANFGEQLRIQREESDRQFAQMMAAQQASQTAMQNMMIQQQQEYAKNLQETQAAQRAFQINQTRGAQTPSLQIQQNTGAAETGGTSAFRKRPSRTMMLSAATDLITPQLNI